MKKISSLLFTILLISLFSQNVLAAETPDYSCPVTGWTSEEIEIATLRCVSKRLSDMKTETATLMLERLCYYEVISTDIETVNKKLSGYASY